VILAAGHKTTTKDVAKCANSLSATLCKTSLPFGRLRPHLH